MGRAVATLCVTGGFRFASFEKLSFVSVLLLFTPLTVDGNWLTHFYETIFIVGKI